MLTKGFKDEEQRKINQVINAGLQLEFIPEDLKSKVHLDELLKQLCGLGLQELIALDEKEQIALLQEKHFNFENIELLGDLLLQSKSLDSTREERVKETVRGLFQFVQRESETYSYSLSSKLEKLSK